MTTVTTVNVSRHQYGLLREIALGNMTIDKAHKCKDGTLHSIVRRKWAVRSGDYLLLTPEGMEVYGSYHSARMPEREREDALRERTARLLNLVRAEAKAEKAKVVQMRKAG